MDGQLGSSEGHFVAAPDAEHRAPDDASAATLFRFVNAANKSLLPGTQA